MFPDLLPDFFRILFFVFCSDPWSFGSRNVGPGAGDFFTNVSCGWLLLGPSAWASTSSGPLITLELA